MGCDRTSQCRCDGGHPWSRLQLLPRHLHRGQRPAGQQHVLHHEHGRPPLLGVARHRRQRLRRVRQLGRLPRCRFHAGTAEAAVSRCARREPGNPCPADALGRRGEPGSTRVPDLLRAARTRDPPGARDPADTDAADAVVGVVRGDRRRQHEQLRHRWHVQLHRRRARRLHDGDQPGRRELRSRSSRQPAGAHRGQRPRGRRA